MNEVDWLQATDPVQLLDFLGPKLSARKARLFACACFRATLHILPDLSYAIDEEALAAVERSAEGVERPPALNEALIYSVGHENAHCAAYDSSAHAVNMGAQLLQISTTQGEPDWQSSVELIRASQAALLRHIVGNPFRHCSLPHLLPSAVVELCLALYEGEDCRLPLSDALEEAGHPHLANHFRDDEWHPKGCWAMDLVLAKNQ